MEVVSQSLSNISETIFKTFVEPVPILGQDPFVGAVFGYQPIEVEFWRWLIPILFGAPLGFLFLATTLSIYSGEWNGFNKDNKQDGKMRAAVIMSCTTLIITSPALAYAFKMIMEGRWGSKVYWNLDDYPMWYNLLTPFLFMVLADFWFYFSHRLFHEVPWLYENSHYRHHTHRPCSSFAGHASDAFEVSVQGYVNALFPLLVVPIHGKVFVFLALMDQMWSIWLHNYYQWRVPGPIILDCADHNVHHFYGQRNHNYALYFKFWDVLCGTYKSLYEVPSMDYLRERHRSVAMSLKKQENGKEK